MSAHPSPALLAVALDGAGWHPAAWREPAARPAELTSARYWVDLVRAAEAGGAHLVTLEDAPRLQSDDPDGPDGRTDRVRGHLDAVLVAARVAPVTSRIGLVPTATVTHTEPFHLSKAIATLDHVSRGRAGVRVRVALRADEAAHVGRRPAPGAEDAFAEAEAWVDVVRRLWDSWEDDAEIRDAATGRFVDRAKLHHIDAASRWFSVRGPSITPRPPQGQPVVAALAHDAPPAQLPSRLLATSADLGFVTPAGPDAPDAATAVARVREAERAAGRSGGGAEPVRLLADAVVVLDERPGAARERLERLDAAAGEPLRSDAPVLAGTPAQVADTVEAWVGAGADGVRLRPAVLPDDLARIASSLAPELARRGLLLPPQGHGGGAAGAAGALRSVLGLARPANRYAA